ncbi:TonB-dependent receptor, partial [bacterium]|nr:TonB-dependent receptor [bacterium]
LTAFAGVDGGMKYNHYFDMIGVNRFLGNDVEIKPSQEKLNIYGGVSGNITEKADYTAMVSYKRIEDALVYTVPVDGAYFAASYDSMMSVFGIHLDLNYDILKELKAGATLDYNAYNTSSLERNFHAPPIKVGVFGTYIWQENLTVSSEINFFGQTPQSLETDGEINKQNAFMDVNLSADYRVTKAFSVWLEFNNLLNAKYERWHNYLERPLDFKGGVTLSF